MGIRDYFEPGNICLIEWPDKGQGILQAADLELTITVIPTGRHLNLTPRTGQGEAVVVGVRSRLAESSISGITISEEAQC